VLYPRAIRTLGVPKRYPSSGQASEEAFDLSKPNAKGRDGKGTTPDKSPVPPKELPFPKELPLPKELPVSRMFPGTQMEAGRR
jgi:hypothetical protein